MKPPARRIRLSLYLAAALVSSALVALALLSRYAEPIARHQIVTSLEARLHCKVELDQVHLKFHPGLEVNGGGLRIMALGSQQRIANGGTPMLSVRSFQFHTTLGALLFHHSSAITAYAQGLHLTIPTGDDRTALQQGDPAKRGQPRDSLFMNRLVATDSSLIVEPADPGHPPFVLNFAELILVDPGGPDDDQLAQPFLYQATLTNPKPLGQIHSEGHIGPWNFASPRTSPVDGNYTYKGVELATISGLAGTLSSSGHIAGPLGAMAVHGTTDTPDFALDISAHPFAVHTEFQALVDGTNGNVALQAVTAHFLHTTVLARGTVLRAEDVPGIAGKGHVTALDVAIRDGRTEDLLTLLARAPQPLLRSAVQLSGHVVVPPGKERLVLKLEATGKAQLTDATWPNPELQQQVNSFSLRASDQGKAKQAIQDPAASPRVLSNLAGSFRIHAGDMQVSALSYRVPGATLLMDGHYPLVATALDFHGVARTDASAANMESGVKHLLLLPVSPFLKKHGAGMELPVSLTGDRMSPHFAIDFANRKVDQQKTEAR